LKSPPSCLLVVSYKLSRDLSRKLLERMENLAYILVCMQWTDFFWAASFYSYLFLSYITFYSVPGALLLFVAVRVLESHWFMWITQMNHIPKEIGHEKHPDWANFQLAATCNVEPSLFIDWFSRHLNFQISTISSPQCRGTATTSGPSGQSEAFSHCPGGHIRSLKSGNVWLDAYLHQ
uniref:Uncharacterized protein n=1 Tax=Castor canadensis TaxID=51338 RepID=A0A8C0W2S9_CASCN